MSGMLVNQYIKEIKTKYVPKKTSDCIEEIVIFTHKAVVYKVVVRYYKGVERRLRKNGIDYFMQILNDFPRTKITDGLVADQTKYENLMIIYRSRTQESTVMSGEDRMVETYSS